MWHEFMVRALANLPNEKFNSPNPISVNKIMLDGNYIYIKDNISVPEYHEILHYVKKDDPLGQMPGDPNQDVQYKNWEWSVKTFFSPAI